MEILNVLTATMPWSCELGHPDGNSCILLPLFPGRGADSAAYCADQAAYP